ARRGVRVAAPRLLPLRLRAERGGGHVAARRSPQPSRTRNDVMKLANQAGRAVLVVEGGVADICESSGGRFGPDPMSVFEDWAAFAEFAPGVTATTGPLVEAELRCPVPV